MWYNVSRLSEQNRIRGISTVGSALHSHCRGHRFESGMLHHKRTLILIQRLAFFLCLKSLALQGFFDFTGCMERAFPLFFGCKRHLMLDSPYSAVQVGCMIKRLLVVEPVAVLYWVHMTVPEKTRYRRTGCQSAERSIGTTLLFIYNYSSSKSSVNAKMDLSHFG